MNNAKKHLGVIGCSALASAAVQAEQSISLHHMDYSEKDERVDVADTVLAIKVDFGVDYSLDLSLGYDSVSGASPAWQINDASGVTNEELILRQETLTAGQALTDQTLLGYAFQPDRYRVTRVELEDTRKSTNAALTVRDEYRNEWTWGLSYSDEDDYQSLGGSFSYLVYLDKFKNRSMNFGISYLDDESLVFGTGYRTRTEEKLNLASIEIGFTQVISPTATLDIKVFANRDDGYLSNHYQTVLRYVDINTNDNFEANEVFVAADSRPDTRNAYGTKISGAYQYQPWLTSQFSYRYYNDTWGIDSHTVEASIAYEVFDGFFINPKVTWYQQTPADFYRNPNQELPAFAPTGFASNDVRLGDYNAQTYSLAVSYQVSQHWQFDISATDYEQTNQFGAKWYVAGMTYSF
ncbi:DUF3570 domain-containing protein [Thalassotalea euphylliae]|uniref:DUF3570 domain-containing protein n=1 Tax=Thalassotalea euphylliae TaxID=1655234 RepID=A0A3E0TNU7_9GAMM|nr:DUF3570 domain-containing protein [Thalassotalea euphylliae]REL25960.1 DUF3570 domain-containing protein [Thalassotalea euphylliae]